MKATVTALVVAAAMGPALFAPSAVAQHTRATQEFVAELHPLNSKVTGHKASGVARFTVRGDSLTISVRVKGVSPDMMHLQHFHGFPDSHQASCATAAADKNHDGIVDLIETEPMSGTTMVPFTADPVSMEIVTDTYPKASANGTYDYKVTVSLSALNAAFGQKYDGHTIDLARRVVYIHGVPASTTLPSTVASLGTIPAQVTIPIACGAIKKVK